MLTIVATVIVLGILIFVHELGHFLAAKALGVRVERFSLGFPPKMAGFRAGETEYVISWIPLGGYVKMFGENPDEADSVPPEETHRSFSHQPSWARFLIVFGGPAFNFMFAFLVFWIMFAAEGVPHLGAYIGEVNADMPAAAAGLQPGDKIVSIDGRPVTYWDDVLALVKDSRGREVDITVDRDGRAVIARLMPRLKISKNLFGEDIQVPMIGIVARGDMVIEEINPAVAVYYGALRTWELTKLTILSVVKMIQGRISPKTLGGPIFIAQLAGQQAREGIVNLIFLSALLSINLGILNLLPIPVLDGGHLFFFCLEMLFRRPISLAIRERAQQAGVLVLILFMVFVFYNDLTRIFTSSGAGPEDKAIEQHEPGPGHSDPGR